MRDVQKTALAAMAGAILLSSVTFAETAPPSAVTIGILNYPHAVIDVEKTAAFYHDVFGLEYNRPVGQLANPGIPMLVNSPGVTLKMTTMKMPGTKFLLELTQFSAADRKAAQPMHTDPGAADLQLRVRDIDTVFAALQKYGSPIITKSGKPIALGAPGSGTRGIMVRDPDGYPLYVVQAKPPADAPEGNVFAVIMGLTVENMQTTMKFYHDMLGFDFTGDGKFRSNKAVLDLVGAPDGVESLEMKSVVPGTNSAIAFYEYKGLPRKKFHLRVFDPGAPALVLRVTEVEPLLNRLKAAGVEVLSKDKALVQFDPKTRNVFVVDPNGVNLELFQREN